MRLHFIERGKGKKTLLFLHYFGGAASSWNEVMNALQNEFHCIAVDLLGFGKSSFSNTTLSVEESADAMIELITELHLSNFILIGHSMGGKIALAVAAKQPKGLMGLILMAPSPPTPEPMTEEERKKMDEAFGIKTKVEKLLNNAIAKPPSNIIFEREVANNLSASEDAWHWWANVGSKEIIADKMQAIHVRIAIIYGEKDKRFTKRFLQTEFKKSFLSFSLIKIKNSGHFLPVEAPDEVANEIRKCV